MNARTEVFDWASDRALDIIIDLASQPPSFATVKLAETLRQIKRDAERAARPLTMLQIAAARTPADDAALARYGRDVLARAILSPAELRERAKRQRTARAERPRDTEAALQEECQRDHDEERRGGWACGNE